MKSRASRLTSSLTALSSTAMIFFANTASAQDTANRGAVNDQPAAATLTEPTPQSLPEIESLTKDADFTVFMRPDVPDGVRVKALRKLWTTDAVYNNVAPHD